jgi:hypothetical protein
MPQHVDIRVSQWRKPITILLPGGKMGKYLLRRTSNKFSFSVIFPSSAKGRRFAIFQTNDKNVYIGGTYFYWRWER